MLWLRALMLSTFVFYFGWVCLIRRRVKLGKYYEKESVLTFFFCILLNSTRRIVSFIGPVRVKLTEVDCKGPTSAGCNALTFTKYRAEPHLSDTKLTNYVVIADAQISKISLGLFHV